MPRRNSRQKTPRPPVVVSAPKLDKLLYNYAESRSILGCIPRTTFFNWIRKGYLVRGPGRTITGKSILIAIGKESA